MKACSFLPAATHMIYELGLEEYLYGVTEHCTSNKPQVVHSSLEGNTCSSEEIDNIVSRSLQEGKSLYSIDMELLSSLEPDVIFTQEVCNVCQVDTSFVQKAVASLRKQPKMVPLVPRTLNDVFDNILMVAKVFGEEQKGFDYLTSLQRRITNVKARLEEHEAPKKKVMLMEWLDPIYNCGHWMPDQISIAGGVDRLANIYGYSIPIPFENVVDYDPDVLVIAPCGFETERTLKHMNELTNRPGWSELTAVKEERAYVVDGEYFTRPSGTLVDGIEILASLLHPELFQLPSTVKDKVISLKEKPITI